MRIITVDKFNEEPEIRKAELPIDMCQIIDSLDIDWQNTQVCDPDTGQILEEAICRLLEKSIELVESVEEEANGIKSAIKWCFDSYTEDNQTLSFLQACIGLEALLGDKEDSGLPLTEKLADRCAYLTSNTIKGRSKMKSMFKEMYKIRSKLIHGNVLELDSEQAKYLSWGQGILELSIEAEIKHFKTGGA